MLATGMRARARSGLGALLSVVLLGPSVVLPPPAAAERRQDRAAADTTCQLGLEPLGSRDAASGELSSALTSASDLVFGPALREVFTFRSGLVNAR